MSKFERDTHSYEPLLSVVPFAEEPTRFVSVPVFDVLSRFVTEAPRTVASACAGRAATPARSTIQPRPGKDRRFHLRHGPLGRPLRKVRR